MLVLNECADPSVSVKACGVCVKEKETLIWWNNQKINGTVFIEATSKNIL